MVPTETNYGLKRSAQAGAISPPTLTAGMCSAACATAKSQIASPTGVGVQLARRTRYHWRMIGRPLTSSTGEAAGRELLLDRMGRDQAQAEAGHDGLLDRLVRPHLELDVGLAHHDVAEEEIEDAARSRACLAYDEMFLRQFGLFDAAPADERVIEPARRRPADVCRSGG